MGLIGSTCTDLPRGLRRAALVSLGGRCVNPRGVSHARHAGDQGLTLVLFSAQLERFAWDRGCA